jgi:glucokinase
LPYCDGILEDFISKRGIIRTYNELAGPSDVTVKEISERARAGEKAAVLAFSRTGTILARALQPVLTELNINRVIMGGQISRSFDLMEEELRNGFGPGISVTPSNDIGGAVFRGLANLF